MERGFHPEKTSLVCEHDLIGRKTGRVFQAGLYVLRLELRICRKDDLACFIGSKLFQNQIDGNSGPFETRLPSRPPERLRKLHALNSLPEEFAVRSLTGRSRGRKPA